MTRNRDTQSTTPLDTQQMEMDTSLSRRSLLKWAAVSGLVGSVGNRNLSEMVTATEISEESSAPNPPAGEVGTSEPMFEKSLRVKGVGNGLNHYHLETSGGIIQRELSDKQKGSAVGVVEGSVHKDDSDSYRFAGRVTTVWSRGSIAYYVNAPSDE